jgi:hypothetical protein
VTAHPVQPSGSEFTARQASTLASLPETFHRSTNGSVRLIDGGTGWTERASSGITSGARALIVERPSPEPIENLRRLSDLAREHDVAVVVDSPFVGSPAWTACREGLIADSAGAGLLDSVVVVRDPQDLERALLAQIAVVRPLLRGATIRRLYPGAAVLVTVDGTLAATLSAATSVSPGMMLDLVGPHVRWRMELPDDGTARPGHAVRHDALGEKAIRPIHSTASRRTWRSLADQLNGSTRDTYDLDTLLLDLEILATA